ncbi:phage tail protein [Escherichia coli]|uniref:phage tail protein n=1 Tax=Escherichia coli TaxID=562 RepID=UPI002879B741|nr:phage tail protein [Escherichia coli]MDS1727448.1 phage tail protein [Escherichia coli]
MTAKYFAILTNQGAARLANAAALGTKLNLTQMAVGDANGTLPTPDPAQTKLINQKRIAPLNLLTVDPANTSQIIAEQIIPENEGGFWIREIGLYDDDGILIAVANCPETYKPQLQEGSGRTQTIRMILIVSSTSAITLKIDPAVVLATRQYVDDKVIEVKAYADDLMKKHVDAANPHKQYLQINNQFSEIKNAGADAVKAALTNLGLERVVQDSNETRIYSPDKKAYIFTSPSGWGSYTSDPAGYVALGIQCGGTGGKTADEARRNLGIGGAGVLNVGQGANTVAAGDDARITGAMQKSQNGNDIPDKPAFRSNIGLGNAALKNVGTGTGQLPDMSAFSSGAGWAKQPNGLLIQWGINIAGPAGYPTTVSLPVPFTSAFQVVACYDNAASGVVNIPVMCASPVGSSGIYLMCSQQPGGNDVFCRWVAVGK